MNILSFYIGRTILATSLMTLLLLAVIRVLFALIDQTGDFGKGDYNFIDALTYVLLLTPRYIYEFFPMAVLIGSISGLGILSSRSELTVMRAVGKTTGQILGSALKYGLILIIFAIILGEWVAPKTTQMAENLRHRAIYGQQAVKSDKGLWLKDNKQMIYIEQAPASDQLKGISIYHFDANQELEKITRASSANLIEGFWQLKNGAHTHVSKQQIETERFDAWQWQTEISFEHLAVLKLDPDTLNIQSLNEYRNYLTANELETQPYDLAFWRKIFQPISTGVMILLAASFIFGPMRTVSMGARVLVGVLTGLLYFFAVRAFGPVSSVFGLPAIFGALLPPAIFAYAAWFMLRKAG